MKLPSNGLQGLMDQAGDLAPVRVAVVDAAQGLVIQTLRQAHDRGIVEPRLIGDPKAITDLCKDLGWKIKEHWIVPAANDSLAAASAVKLVRDGAADAVMKGNIHTDVLMRALLDKERGVRLAGRQVSHVFVTEVPNHPKLLGITDAAINIAPDLDTKAQILRNAVELYHLLGVELPKVAVLSAVETVNSAIVSTLDAACLTLMARRGQIGRAQVDGPLAFDNAISAAAAKEKGITSEVAGDADIVLVPDLVSGNILAKNLEYLAGAVAAGIVVGLRVPVALSSRADPPAARLAGLALASLMHHRSATFPAKAPAIEASLHCAPQTAQACCPLPG
tara:strand:+ start:2908 stop:3912 length:1005 start_codon:yes stop_codon:yes gene_type:complete